VSILIRSRSENMQQNKFLIPDNYDRICIKMVQYCRLMSLFVFLFIYLSLNTMPVAQTIYTPVYIILYIVYIHTHVSPNVRVINEL